MAEIFSFKNSRFYKNTNCTAVKDGAAGGGAISVKDAYPENSLSKIVNLLKMKLIRLVNLEILQTEVQSIFTIITPEAVIRTDLKSISQTVHSRETVLLTKEAQSHSSDNIWSMPRSEIIHFMIM